MSDAFVVDDRVVTDWILQRAARCGIRLDRDHAAPLVHHMRRVVHADASLHLTSIHTVDEFLERHIGESLEGAALLERDLDGWLLDLGSGNGYPGLPVAMCHRGLRPLLAEASARKAGFLRSVLDECFPLGRVIDRQIQRADDLGDEPMLSVIVTRAMGNWERVLPRLSSQMKAGGRVLVWAGSQMESVADRQAWRRYRLVARRALPGRERSWVWSFQPKHD
jgi:16S rRNA (guanine527-N7)-methyltransferase